MATYLELFDLQNDDNLLHRVTVAVAVAAEAIRSETPGTPNHINRFVWAEKALADPRAVTPQVMWAVLAANKDVSTSAIQSASDSSVQADVDNVVDVLAGS